jgi:hypothetical protein
MMTVDIYIAFLIVISFDCHNVWTYCCKIFTVLWSSVVELEYSDQLFNGNINMNKFNIIFSAAGFCCISFVKFSY